MSKGPDTKFHQLGNFLRQTTVHGVRYVLDGRTLAEKLAWMVIISVSFSYSGYLIITSVQETKENPITSVVEVVDAKTIKFPAVTIYTKPVARSPYRFIATIYNSFKFDCSQDGGTPGKCLEETKKLRADFEPLIRNFMNKTAEQWKTLSSKKRYFRDLKSSAWFESLFTNWTQGKDQFLKYFCHFWQFHSWGFQGFNAAQREEFLTALAENFQVSPAEFQSGINSFLAQVTDQIKKSHDLFYSIPLYSCASPLISQYSFMINTILMLWSSAHDPKELISLGDLLLIAHDQHVAGLAEENGLIEPNYGKNLSFSLPDKMFSVLTEAESQLTADDIIKFVSGPHAGIKSITSNFKNSLTAKSNCKNGTSHGRSTLDESDCSSYFFHLNLSHSLRVLKYLVQPAHSKMHPGQMLEEFKMATDLAKDIYIPKCHFKENNCQNYDPVFCHCQFGHVTHDKIIKATTKDDCFFFRRTFGVKGISYEFNPSIDFFDIYSNKNTYNRIFYEEIHSQDIESQGKDIVLSNEYTLDFFIHPDSFEKYVLSGTELTSPKLAIHQPTTIPINFIKLRRGYWYSITVTPSMITTDEDLIDVPENKRGCRFTSEYDPEMKGSIFASYTHNGCLFECQLRKVFSSANATNCLPWDSPHVEDPISVCHGERADNYDSSPFAKDSTKNCNCPVDCNIIGYSYTWNKRPMTGLCNQLLKNPWQKVFLLFNNGGEWDYQYKRKDECGERYNKLLTRVTINMDTSMVTNTRRMRRTVIADQIAGLGGLVVLFTGMSMLTLVEIVMWMARYAVTTIFCCNSK